jgi:hypothetical protein
MNSKVTTQRDFLELESLLTCRDCKDTKPLRKMKVKDLCISCANLIYVKKYKKADGNIFTGADRKKMYQEQEGKCDCCSRNIFIDLDFPNPKASRNSVAVVHHCHTVGIVKALLCSPCNSVLTEEMIKNYHYLELLAGYAEKENKFIKAHKTKSKASNRNKKIKVTA